MAVDDKTAFVTGGTGKIGRHLVRRLVAQGFQVNVLVRREDRDFAQARGVHVYEGDILKVETYREAIEKCRFVFHLAAYQNINDKDISRFRQVNVEGTRHLAEASKAAPIEMFVYVSTAMLFEATGEEPRDERWPQKSSFCDDPYLETKREALEVIRSLKEGLPIVVVYPTAVIDLGDFGVSDPSSTGVQKIIWQRLGSGVPGGVVSLIGPADRVFNYVIVDDLIDGLISAALNGRRSEEYILGGENVPVEEYRRAACRRLKRKPFPCRLPLFPFRAVSSLGRFVPVPAMIHVIARHGRDSMCLSSQKAKSELAYHPQRKI